MNLTDGPLVDKELAGWMHPKGCDQQLEVREESSEGWGVLCPGLHPKQHSQQVKVLLPPYSTSTWMDALCPHLGPPP